jgi:hypothetical protein
MKLLREIPDGSELETVAEAAGSDGKKKTYVRGVFLQSEVRNRNGRVYPRKTLGEEVDRYVRDYVDTKRAIGELSHPSSATLNPERACHLVTSLVPEGANFIGKALVIESVPMGAVLKGLLDSGVRVGVSSRGMGTLKPVREGVMEVQPDFRLVSIDCVMDPSAPDAYVTSVMESVEWVLDPVLGEWVAQRVEDDRRYVRKLSSRQIEEGKLELFRRFLNRVAGDRS